MSCMLFLAGAEKDLKFHTDIQLNTFKQLQGKKGNLVGIQLNPYGRAQKTDLN